MFNSYIKNQTSIQILTQPSVTYYNYYLQIWQCFHCIFTAVNSLCHLYIICITFFPFSLQCCKLLLHFLNTSFFVFDLNIILQQNKQWFFISFCIKSKDSSKGCWYTIPYKGGNSCQEVRRQGCRNWYETAPRSVPSRQPRTQALR